jgi:hypothetical protein
MRQAVQTIEALREENAQLQEELAKLKDQARRYPSKVVAKSQAG